MSVALKNTIRPYFNELQKPEGGERILAKEVGTKGKKDGLGPFELTFRGHVNCGQGESRISQRSNIIIIYGYCLVLIMVINLTILHLNS